MLHNDFIRVELYHDGTRYVEHEYISDPPEDAHRLKNPREETRHKGLKPEVAIERMLDNKHNEMCNVRVVLQKGCLMSTANAVLVNVKMEGDMQINQRLQTEKLRPDPERMQYSYITKDNMSSLPPIKLPSPAETNTRQLRPWTDQFHNVAGAQVFEFRNTAIAYTPDRLQLVDEDTDLVTSDDFSGSESEVDASDGEWEPRAAKRDQQSCDTLRKTKSGSWKLRSRGQDNTSLKSALRVSGGGDQDDDEVFSVEGKLRRPLTNDQQVPKRFKSSDTPILRDPSPGLLPVQAAPVNDIDNAMPEEEDLYNLSRQATPQHTEALAEPIVSDDRSSAHEPMQSLGDDGYDADAEGDISRAPSLGHEYPPTLPNEVIDLTVDNTDEASHVKNEVGEPSVQVQVDMEAAPEPADSDDSEDMRDQMEIIVLRRKLRARKRRKQPATVPAAKLESSSVKAE
ncbi:hypothetical protein LTR10_000171 [Elasticomyces elasticus]|nr:hypothetical protein LTR10_000171 [Elasticomyces elasticus]KAK4980570.1 hypothetical protein LTR42_000878 [Elasticomyces elasticus]